MTKWAQLPKAPVGVSSFVHIKQLLVQRNFELRSVYITCGYIQIVFHTSHVLEVGLRQATFLTSEFHCPVPRLWGQSNILFHSASWSNSMPNWRLSWALQTSDNRYVGPGQHTFLLIVTPWWNLLQVINQVASTCCESGLLPGQLMWVLKNL